MREILQELRVYAEENKVPIIKDEALDVLINVCKEKQPQYILEIGTAIGYSVLTMLNNIDVEAKVISLEIDEERAAIAGNSIAKAGLSDRVKVLVGDAGKILLELQKMNEKFDLVFIDAAKAQYMDYLTKVIPMLADGSVVIADNVLFRGYVEGIEETPRRFRTIVRRLREYINIVTNSSSSFETTIYKDADGIAVSHYRGCKNE